MYQPSILESVKMGMDPSKGSRWPFRESSVSLTLNMVIEVRVNECHVLFGSLILTNLASSCGIWKGIDCC